MRFISAAMILLSFCILALGQETVKTFTFKKTKQADLAIHVHFPPDWKKEDKRPAIVFFFGGGFQFGDVSQFVPQAAYFASRGMVAARADYRVKSRHGVEPDTCVEDAKSAVRWLRQNAAKLGLDANRLVACGSSSGGYLAASTACPGLEPEGEDLKISSRANAMILVNPFLPFVKEKANWKIVPTLHLSKETPPTLILFGTKDQLLPRADEFMAKSKEVGHKAEMFLAEGVGHGFAGKSPWREKVIQRDDEFLVSLGYLQGKPTIKVPDAKDVEPKKAPPKNFTNSIGMKFAWIPPGTFMMGSPNEELRRSNYETQHKVTLTKGFYMGVYAVTQDEWQALMGNNPSHFKGEKNLPVEKVSWDDCQEFIKKLREKDKKAYRLPTEAEWEYACRAGTTTPFCFGATISTDQANYDSNQTYGNGKKGVYREKTTPVGSFPANAWGLHDMPGNVWQWCQDCYGDYPANDVVDPQGKDKGESRVLRGGSWNFSPASCRSASRHGSVPYRRSPFIGFRVCFSVEPTIKVPDGKDQKPKAQPKPKVPPPTFENVKYGPHERNVLDFWQAKSEQPTPVLVSIHGGGFVQGNKSVGPFILKDCLDNGISVAAINYRYSTQAIAPAPFEDGARAVQFLRSKAKEWNIDPKRFAATGGSAGAGISLWLGFHKDMTDPKNDDPVLRQSTRLTCMFVTEGQTSYDPRFIRKLFPDKDIYKIGALQKLFDFNPNQLDALPAEKYKLFEECSPITHVTKDAPPVLLFYNNPIDAEITSQGIGIHHSLFGKALKEKMDALKIPCEVVAAGKRLDGGTPTRSIEFLKVHFGLKK